MKDDKAGIGLIIVIIAVALILIFGAWYFLQPKRDCPSSFHEWGTGQEWVSPNRENPNNANEIWVVAIRHIDSGDYWQTQLYVNGIMVDSYTDFSSPNALLDKMHEQAPTKPIIQEFIWWYECMIEDDHLVVP